jgi:hypothetical protein
VTLGAWGEELHPVARDAWGRATVGDDAPEAPPTHGFTIPGEVLAYRRTWQPYVAEGIALMRRAAASWAALARGEVPAMPPRADLPILATAESDARTTAYNLISAGWAGTADTRSAEWDQDAGAHDWKIIVFAGNILQDEERTVRAVSEDLAKLKEDFPSATLPEPPGFDAQAEVLGRLEAMGLVAHGTLEILGLAAGGVLGKVGDVSGTVLKASKDVLNLAGPAAEAAVKLADFLPYLVLALFGLVGYGVARLTSPEGERLATRYMEHRERRGAHAEDVT